MTDRTAPDLKEHWPHYDDEQVAAAVRVLQSSRTNYWTGTECRDFEAEFAGYVGMPHAISLANGTVALELALIALGVGPGDEVVVPCSSFIATASSVVACGAVPVFADVDSQTQTLTVDTLKACLTTRTRAIIVVHLYGWVCPMDEIMVLAGQHGLRVIEDCAQAHGARYRDKCAGSFGDAAAFSFCQDKIISTGGEGGMLLCRTEPVWRNAWSYKDHGKHPSGIDAKPGTEYRYIHKSAGTNWRMTEIQAAIGRVQLRHLNAWVARRQQIAALLQNLLSPLANLQLPAVPPETRPAWYRFPMQLRVSQLQSGWGRDRLVCELNQRGVACGPGVCPELYREQALERFAPDRRAANARQLAETALCLTMHHRMPDDYIEKTATVVRSVLSMVSK